jgi:hypothetical protein
MSVGRSQLFASSVAAVVLGCAAVGWAPSFCQVQGGGGGAQVGPLRLCVHPRRQTAPPPCGCGPVQIRARTGTAWRAGHLRRGKKYTIVVTVWGCPCTRADMADDRALHCTQRARSLSGFLSLMVVRGRKPPFLTSSQVE